jgi:carbonic anhydrase
VTPDRETKPEIYQPANALVISCSESPTLSAFAYLMEPRCIVQNLGGTLPSVPPTSGAGSASEESAWGTVDYAVDHLAIGHIVLCGHSRCCVPAMWLRGEWDTRNRGDRTIESAIEAQFLDADRASQSWLTEQANRLEGFLARRRHRSDITTHTLWFDEDRGDLLILSGKSRQFVSADDAEIRQFLRLLNVPEQRAQEVIKQCRQLAES